MRGSARIHGSNNPVQSAIETFCLGRGFTGLNLALCSAAGSKFSDQARRATRHHAIQRSYLPRTTNHWPKAARPAPHKLRGQDYIHQPHVVWPLDRSLLEWSEVCSAPPDLARNRGAAPLARKLCPRENLLVRASPMRRALCRPDFTRRPLFGTSKRRASSTQPRTTAGGRIYPRAGISRTTWRGVEANRPFCCAIRPLWAPTHLMGSIVATIYSPIDPKIADR